MAISSQFFLFWPLKRGNLYKFKDHNLNENIFKLFPKSNPANWDAKRKTLQYASPIFCLSQLLGKSKAKNCSKLFMFSWTSLFSLRLAKLNLGCSIKKASSLSVLFNIGDGDLKILSYGEYWWNNSFGYYVFKNMKKKEVRQEKFFLNKFFGT